MCKSDIIPIVFTIASLLVFPIASGSVETIDRHHIEKRLAGSKECDISKAPFVVMIQVKKPDGDAKVYNGIIINPLFVLTMTRQSLKNADRNTFSVIAGCSKFATACPTQQIRTLNETFYNEDGMVLLELKSSIVAFEILKLNEPFTIGPNVAEAKFKTDQQGFAADCKKGIFYSIGDDADKQLTQTELTMTDDVKSCTEVYFLHNTKNFLVSTPDKVDNLAGFTQHGGPLVCEGYLVAISDLSISMKDKSTGCSLFVNVEGLFDLIGKKTAMNLPKWSASSFEYSMIREPSKPEEQTTQGHDGDAGHDQHDGGNGPGAGSTTTENLTRGNLSLNRSTSDTSKFPSQSSFLLFFMLFTTIMALY